jgi:hypothetical protein
MIIMDSSKLRPLFISPDATQTGESFLSTQYILRKCNEDYRRETGSFHKDAKKGLPAEFDCYPTPGKVPSLLTFDNFQGHAHEGYTRFFDPPVHHESIQSFHDHLTKCMQKTVKRSRAWDLDGTKKFSVTRMASNIGGSYSPYLAKCMATQMKSQYQPISVHPIHAHSESVDKYNKDSALFKMPSISTIVTGPFGGYHNNTSVEMGFEEKEGTKDLVMRTYDRKHLGFFCCGYTSHSSDAGKTRRLCSFTRIRVSSQTPLWPITDHLKDISEEGDWTIYCMGSTVNVSKGSIEKMIRYLNKGSSHYFDTQFDVSERRTCAAPPTYMLYADDKVLYLSISPGVILRSTPSGFMIDSSMLYDQSETPMIRKIVLPKIGDESIKYFYNPWYLHAYLTKLNRQPRPLFACGQLTQGVFFPWSPATARVSPSHASSPIVATQYTRDMEADSETNPDAIWDIFPGEDMTVCFINLPENFEDSMMVSTKFADMGGFSTISECTYRISEKDSLPKEGERLCGKKYKWWKMPCPLSCRCVKSRDNNNIIEAGRIPTSLVTSVNRTKDGAISIKILSFAQLMTGDKISMTAGQKGVAHLVEYEDLPVIVMKDGSSFVADLYMAVGSVVSRQTNGMIIESELSRRGAMEGKKVTVGYADDCDLDECKFLINPITGKPMTCQLQENGPVSIMKASVGMIRVINQTQMTRERHHLTHNSEGKRSVSTTSGRAAGGGVAAAEMDFHAMFSSGLIGCAQELFDRGNCVRVPFCMICNRITVVHDCSEMHMDNIVRVRMSYDVSVLDEMSASINQSANVYRVEHV